MLGLKKEYTPSWGKGVAFVFGKVSPRSQSKPHSDHSFTTAGPSPPPCSASWVYALGSGSGELCPRRVCFLFFPNASDRRMSVPFLETGFQMIAKEGLLFFYFIQNK